MSGADEPTTTTMERVVLGGVPRPALSQVRWFMWTARTPQPAEGELFFTRLLVEFAQARKEGRPPPGTEEEDTP